MAAGRDSWSRSVPLEQVSNSNPREMNMVTRSIFSALALLVALTSLEATAIQGVCGTRQLPRDRVRKLRNLRLECTSATQHYIRTPMPFDIDKWREAELLDKDRDLMQKIGQEQPKIQWGGTLIYETIEAWDWTDWVYGQDPVCGYDAITTTSTDSKGNTTTSTTYVMRSCWHDEDRSEARNCSTETMPYTAEFVRPSLAEWSPKNPEYYDILPNKYDLLPGEAEDVQVFSNKRQSAEIAPKIQVNDAWNEYATDVTLDGRGAVAACRFNQTLRLHARVHTVKRLQRATPNAFRAPVDPFGREVESLGWLESINKKNETVRTRPREMRLMDASEVMIAALARTTRSADTEIEKARQETNAGRTTDPDKLRNFERKRGFWKDTNVRIRFYKIEPLGRDIKVSPHLYTRGAEASDRGNYKIDLESIYRGSSAFSDEFWKGIRIGLEPNRRFVFYVAMFQKGVPFYAQDCDDPNYKNHWNCRLGLRGENSWYSKELPIRFKSDPYYDDRPALQKLSNWQSKPLWRKVWDLVH